MPDRIVTGCRIARGGERRAQLVAHAGEELRLVFAAVTLAGEV
jgi:hypothetical protein